MKNVGRRSSSLQNNFGKSSEIFGKWSEIFRKLSKASLLVCLYNKQNFTCLLVDTNFIFSCSTRYLTRSLPSPVRYRVSRTLEDKIHIHAQACNILYIFNCEATILFHKSFGKRYGLLYILSHSTLSPSELMRVFFISYGSYEHCSCSLY